MKFSIHENKGILIKHSLLGGFVGIIFLHPLTMAIYWFEFHPDIPNVNTVWHFIMLRMGNAFHLEMLPMTFIFVFTGCVFGMISGLYSRSLLIKDRIISLWEYELGGDIESIVKAGENQSTEFKSSARWDLHKGQVDKRIEYAIVKTIAAFQNHKGGNLLIGIDDTGKVVGIENDYKTLKRSSKDGFEIFLMTLIKDRIGAAACPFVHVIFNNVEGKDVCRVIVEPANQPIYVKDKGLAKFFLRTGNSTRELDAEQAHKHITSRWP